MNISEKLPAAPGLLLYNALIYTQNPAQPKASILVSQGKEIIYVGDELSQAQKLLVDGGLEIDLEGLTLIPGLTDGHAHLFGEGEKLGMLNLRGLDFQQTLWAVQEEASRRREGEWILGMGWNQERWPGGRWPHRRDLDEAAPLNPVILDRQDKHSSWVNSLALRLGGLAPNTPPPPPPGGEYLLDDKGELQGILIGSGMWVVKNAGPSKKKSGLLEALLRAQEEMFSYGITSVMDAGMTMSNLEIMEQAYISGQLKLRVRVMLLPSNSDKAYQAASKEAKRGLYDERFSIEGIKIHSDGSLGSRSAWLSRDYADRPGHRGGHSYSDEELYDLMKKAHEQGLIISIHAIGDAAVHQALATMRAVLGEKPGDKRWRVEHFQVVQPEDMNMAITLGVIPSIQTVGLMNDLTMVEDRLDPELLNRSYLWREVLDKGGILVNGADGPVESVNPYEGLYAAVSRRDLSGYPAGGWRPQDKLNREEALLTYTAWAAYSEFNENRKGRLNQGYLADLAVIDHDYMSCPEDEIKNITCLMTVLAGEVVYQKKI